MDGYRLRKVVAVALLGSILFQIGGCAGSLIPAVLGSGEQIGLSRLFSRFLLF